MQIGLVYQDRKRWDKFRWVHHALERLGHDVFRCTSIADVLHYNDTCDLMLFEQRNAGLCEYDLLKIRKSEHTVWAQWWFDLLSRDDWHLVKSFGNIMQKMDVCYTKCNGLPPIYGTPRDAGIIDPPFPERYRINSTYLDQGCPSDMPACEHREDPEFDALILGTMSKHYLGRQIAAHMLAGAGLRVAIVGEGMPRGENNLGWVDPFDLPAQFSRAAVVVHIDITNKVPGYRSDSFWLKMGAGACVVVDACVGNVTWPSDLPVDYVTYTDQRELLSVVHELRRNVDRRRETGENARRYTMEHRTYETQCAELIEDVERIKREQAVPSLSR